MAKDKKNKEKKEVEENDEINDIKEKKPKKEKKSKKDKKPKKKKGCFFTILIVLLLIGIVIALFKFNVGGISDKVRPTLSKIPVINKILPQAKKTETPKDVKPEKTQEAIQIDALNSQIRELNLEVERLKVFENAQVKFKEDKNQFDQMIALKDPKAYSSFYQQISPENADKLYKEALIKDEQSKKLDDYMKTFENMKKDAASKILEELMLTDTDLVISILGFLSSEKRAEILSTMDSKNASTCIKLLSPK